MSRAKIFISDGYPEDLPEELEKLGVDAETSECFALGETTSDQIASRISMCDFVMISITADNRGDYRHITKFLALNKAYDGQSADIISVKFDQDADVPVDLSHFDCLDYSSTDFWAKLKTRLESRAQLKDLLPVGNVAPGLVWNYFYGYLMRIIKQYPELYMQEVNARAYGENVQSLRKLIILLPKNCTCEALLDEYDENIKYLPDKAIEQTKDRAGQGKIMLQAVYQIQDSGETFVLMVEVPNIITTISKLTQREGISFRQSDVHKHYAAFHSALREALEYEKEAQNMYLIIEFDENDPNLKLGKLIADKVREEKQKMQSQMDIDYTTNYDYDANFVTEGSDGDDELSKLKEKLENADVKVYSADEEIVGTVFENAAKGIQNSRKTIIWIDREVKGWQKFVYAQTQCAEEDRRKGLLIPVVKGKPDNISINDTTDIQYLRNLNHLYSEEPDFFSKLKNAVTGETPLTYPLGDIAKGLVWTYCLNYLEQNLDSYVEHYKETLKYDKESVLYPKFICLIPETCHAPGKIIEYDSTIERMTDNYKEEILFKKVVAGKERKYNIPINKVTFSDGKQTKVYKVMCEFVTPLAALAALEKGMKTQLSQMHKLRQREIFDELFEKVLKSGQKAGNPLRHCAILKFKDEFMDQTNRRGPKFNLSEQIAMLVEADRGAIFKPE